MTEPRYLRISRSRSTISAADLLGEFERRGITFALTTEDKIQPSRPLTLEEKTRVIAMRDAVFEELRQRWLAQIVSGTADTGDGSTCVGHPERPVWRFAPNGVPLCQPCAEAREKQLQREREAVAEHGPLFEGVSG